MSSINSFSFGSTSPLSIRGELPNDPILPTSPIRFQKDPIMTSPTKRTTRIKKEDPETEDSIVPTSPPISRKRSFQEQNSAVPNSPPRKTGYRKEKNLTQKIAFSTPTLFPPAKRAKIETTPSTSSFFLIEQLFEQGEQQLHPESFKTEKELREEAKLKKVALADAKKKTFACFKTATELQGLTLTQLFQYVLSKTKQKFENQEGMSQEEVENIYSLLFLDQFAECRMNHKGFNTFDPKRSTKEKIGQILQILKCNPLI